MQVQGHDAPQRQSFDGPASVANWQGYYAAPVWDRAVGRHRPGSLVLTNPAQGAIERPAQLAKVFSVEPKQACRISARVRTESVLGRNGVTLRMGERRINGRLFNTHDWRLLVGETVADEKGKIPLIFHMHYTQGAAWLDDLAITPIREHTWRSRPWQLSRGKGRFAFDALVPDGMEIKVRLVRAADHRVLVRDLRPDHNLVDLFDLFGDTVVQLDLTVRSWQNGTMWIRRIAIE